MSRGAALAAALIALATTTPATAKIVIGKSIHGLGPGDKEKRFRAVLGAPDGPRDFGEDPVDYGLDFRGARYHALFLSSTHRADLISTTNRRERTSTGVGPGVSAKFASATLKGEHCGRIYDADRGIDIIQCTIRTGSTETSVDIAGGRVFEVEILAGG